ncbi:MAG: 3-dehydroquinate synthase [Pseudomonadota bacterium]
MVRHDIDAPVETEISWQRFSVPYDYPVAFTRGLFRSENPLFADMLSRREGGKRHRVMVYIDDGIAKVRPDLLNQIRDYSEAHKARIELLGIAPVPGGEKIKTELTWIEEIQDTVHHRGIDRHSYLVAIGGGAVLDAVGLAAATAHRGVRHIRVPTTVLSQNDSGVGVKNAVNLKGYKNFIGTFAPPWAVLNDFDFLNDLPRRERIAGLSEAVKVALIRDRDFYEWIEANSDALVTFARSAEEYMIRRSAELHMHQIANGGDPFEMGSARPLDFGHWAAHKLESLTRSHLRHGEAVAIGIALDTRYSVLTGLLEKQAGDRVVSLLEHLGLRIFHPALLRAGEDRKPLVLKGLDEFREHLGGDLTITLLTDLGTGHEVHEMDSEKVLEAMHWLRDREGG